MHSRIPALAALLLGLAVGFGALAATGQFRATHLEQATLKELESKIADTKDAAVWCAYGDKLQSVSRFTDAAKAYQKALDLQPDSTDARVSRAVALAQSNDADAFFAYFSRLTSCYPKLAMDLLDRPQLAPVKSDQRWEAAASAARAQAVD